MIIKSTRINFNLQWDNDPDIEIFIQTGKHYQKPNFVYEERNGIYRAENDKGITDFFMWKGNRNEGGCGGIEWDITMQDGNTRRIKGPWIGTSDEVNKVFPDRAELVEASYIDHLDKFHRYGGSITIKKVCELLNIPEMGFNQFKIYTLELKKLACKNNPKLGYRAERIDNKIKTIRETGSRWG